LIFFSRPAQRGALAVDSIYVRSCSPWCMLEGPLARPRIQLVVTDLDNTLYDWVEWFCRGLTRMSTSAAAILGIEHETFLEELRAAHVSRGTVEDADAMFDLPSVRAAFDTRQAAAEALAVPLRHRRDAQQARPRMYPGVVATLRTLRQAGVKVVAHTEAPARAALDRLARLGLDAELDALYARVMTPGLSAADRPPLRQIDPEHRKPEPAAVLEICEAEGVEPAATVYVGDNLARDVWMAREAGAIAVWAQYGATHDETAWGDLKRVSHWRQGDVERFERHEIDVLRAAAFATLRESFAELLEHFELGSAVSARA
jgi:phosphoglycolate phosphatase